MIGDLKIDLSNLREELAAMPDIFHKVLAKVQQLEEKHNEAKSNLEILSHEISADINLNPEKHGFPFGSAPERFKVNAIIVSHPEYKKQVETVAYYHSRLAKANVEKTATYMKFEALKCLIAGQ